MFSCLEDCKVVVCMFVDEESGVYDCVVMCWSVVYFGDGVCYDGIWLDFIEFESVLVLDFNCVELVFDEGDCGGCIFGEDVLCDDEDWCNGVEICGVDYVCMLGMLVVCDIFLLNGCDGFMVVEYDVGFGICSDNLC